VPGSTWAEPDQAELARLMREVYDNPKRDAIKSKVAQAKALIENQFSWDAVGARWIELIDVLRTEARTVDLAMVTPWNSRCGIAEYSRQLVTGFGARVRTVVLADRNVQPVDLAEEPTIARVWDDRWHSDLTDLIAAIDASPAELVHFQFNFGFFDLGALSGFIDAVRAERAVLITFHATADTPIDGELVSLRSITDALGRADLLIVHQQTDLDRLAGFGLVDNVRLIPQGAPGSAPVSRETARDALLLGDRPTVSTFGFLLPHKGTLELLRAIDLVRREVDDVLLLAPCAIHPDPISTQYLDVCQREIDRLGLGSNVTLVTEFLQDDEARTLLVASDVIALPYADTPESSSAALRFVLGIGAPVITTDIPIFADAADVLLQIPSNAPTALAEAILEVLQSPGRASELAAAAQLRAAELSWPSVAQAHLSAYHRVLTGRRGSRASV
jgi:glycosyltransferase involved in cell wall biosynthesis